MTVSQPKIEQRQRLYHRRYQYAIELGSLRFEYMDRLDPHWVTSMYKRNTGYAWRATKTTDSIEQVLETAGELLDIELGELDVKVQNSWHTRFYYTNNDLLVFKLDRVPGVDVRSYRQANVSLPDGVVLRKNSQYQYRTYFKERKIDPARGAEFMEAVHKYGDYFKINDNTRERLSCNRYNYPFTRHSYVDHNSPHDRLMLEMMLPGYLGRTLPIQTK